MESLTYPQVEVAVKHLTVIGWVVGPTIDGLICTAGFHDNRCIPLKPLNLPLETIRRMG